MEEAGNTRVGESNKQKLSCEEKAIGVAKGNT
jgi:hypothetical protein